jgi:membrane protease YdiL (CAAX protease family)
MTPARDSGRALCLVAVATVWNYASDRIADHLGVETESFASPWKFPLVALGTTITCAGIVGLGTLVWGRTSLRDLGWTLSNPRRLVFIGLLQAAAIVGMIVAIYAVFGGLSGVRELGHDLASLSFGQRAFFALMGVKNAFFEESLFRGDLIRSLARRMSTTAAVIVSSAVFALYHRTLDPVPLLMKFAMGVLFALSATRTRSLVPSALSHALVWAIMCNA